MDSARSTASDNLAGMYGHLGEEGIRAAAMNNAESHTLRGFRGGVEDMMNF